MENNFNKCPEIRFSELSKGQVRTRAEKLCKFLSQTHAYKLRSKKPKQPQRAGKPKATKTIKTQQQQKPRSHKSRKSKKKTQKPESQAGNRTDRQTATVDTPIDQTDRQTSTS